MNWLTNFVRPKIRSIVKRDVPEHLWEKCPACGNMVFHRELQKNRRICTHCDYHMRLPAEDRLHMLLDEGSIRRLDLPETVQDPLKFKDLKKYNDRLKDSRKKTGEEDALVLAEGTMDSHVVVTAVLDFRFMGGSMGTRVGEGFVAGAEAAIKANAPYIVVTASGGARMQEGILSLMQMAKTTAAVNRLREAGLPYIVVLTDPTTGGVTASFAMLGDIAIAEPSATIGFAGARVIEQTIRESLPEGFQKADYLLEHGMVDMVVNRKDLRAMLIRLIGFLMNPRPAGILPLSQEGSAPRGRSSHHHTRRTRRS